MRALDDLDCRCPSSVDSRLFVHVFQRHSNILMIAVNQRKSGLDVVRWLVKEQHIDPNDSDDVLWMLVGLVVCPCEFRFSA